MQNQSIDLPIKIHKVEIDLFESAKIRLKINRSHFLALAMFSLYRRDK